MVRYNKEVKFKLEKWNSVRIMIVNTYISIFFKTEDSNFSMILYEQLAGSVFKLHGGLFVGTNNMLAHFDNIKLNRLFLTMDQFNDIMKQTKDKQDTMKKELNSADDNDNGSNTNSGTDAEGQSSSYRFKHNIIAK